MDKPYFRRFTNLPTHIGGKWNLQLREFVGGADLFKRRIVRDEWRVNVNGLAYAATANAQYFPNLQDCLEASIASFFP